MVQSTTPRCVVKTFDPRQVSQFQSKPAIGPFFGLQVLGGAARDVYIRPNQSSDIDTWFQVHSRLIIPMRMESFDIKWGAQVLANPTQRPLRIRCFTKPVQLSEGYETPPNVSWGACPTRDGMRVWQDLGAGFSIGAGVISTLASIDLCDDPGQENAVQQASFHQWGAWLSGSGGATFELSVAMGHSSTFFFRTRIFGSANIPAGWGGGPPVVNVQDAGLPPNGVRFEVRNTGGAPMSLNGGIWVFNKF